MVILGLTGSIGMGKSTTAGLLRRGRAPVHDADAAVHRLYAGTAAARSKPRFRYRRGRKVDRARLGEQVIDDPAALKRLEAIVHPLVRATRNASCRRPMTPARQSPCSTSRCCSRPAARRAATRSWWCRRRPKCSARAS